MESFMGLPLPMHWHIMTDPLSGNHDLVRDNDMLRGRSGMEVYRLIAEYWRAKKERENEQHRQSNQAPRNPTPAQRPAGNAGGTPPSASPVSSYGAGTWQAALAAQGAKPGGIMPLPSASHKQMMWEAMRQAMIHGKGRAWLSLDDFDPPKPKPVLPRCKATVGELIGHRAWTVKGGNLLTSVSAGSAWLPGQPMHHKVGSNGLEIDDHNAAGVWCFKDPYDLANQFWSTIQNGGVFGTVWLWGTVIEHDRGYRAEFAAIRSLDRAAPGVDLEILRTAYLKNTQPPTAPK